MKFDTFNVAKYGKVENFNWPLFPVGYVVNPWANNRVEILCILLWLPWDSLCIFLAAWIYIFNLHLLYRWLLIVLATIRGATLVLCPYSLSPSKGSCVQEVQMSMFTSYLAHRKLLEATCFSFIRGRIIYMFCLRRHPSQTLICITA